MAGGETAVATEWRRLEDAVERKRVYLQPGRVVVALEPTVITTILGSCVAICLWDDRLHCGGMNHYMLPFETSPKSGSARFGTEAWSQLLGGMIQLGARREHLRAAVFGGACVTETFRMNPEHVGARNAQLAASLLSSERIHVVHRDVGGRLGRKLLYETDSGRFSTRML